MNRTIQTPQPTLDELRDSVISAALAYREAWTARQQLLEAARKAGVGPDFHSILDADALRETAHMLLLAVAAELDDGLASAEALQAGSRPVTRPRDL